MNPLVMYRIDALKVDAGETTERLEFGNAWFQPTGAYTADAVIQHADPTAPTLLEIEGRIASIEYTIIIADGDRLFTEHFDHEFTDEEFPEVIDGEIVGIAFGTYQARKRLCDYKGKVEVIEFI